MADFSAGPVVTGTTHMAYTVEEKVARRCALTVAERAPDAIPLLLSMLGIIGRDGPDDGKWANYAYGRPKRREVEDA